MSIRQRGQARANSCERTVFGAWFKACRHSLTRKNAWLVLALLLLAFDAHAWLDAVEPGEIPELGPEEGLLLVAVDTSIELDRARIARDGKWFASGSMTDIALGRSARLYVAHAGHYQWDTVNTVNRVPFKLRDDPEFAFSVEPGKITYGGDLVFRPETILSAVVHVSNRGLHAMDWLDANHPAIAERYRFVYSGHYPDPFPQFYRAALEKSGSSATELNAIRAPPNPDTLPLDIQDLWRDGRVTGLALNATGNLLAEAIRTNDGNWAIDLIDLQAGSIVRVAQSPSPFDTMLWSGDNVLVTGVGEDDTEQSIHVLRIDKNAAGKRTFESIRIDRPGYVVDALPADPDHILFASHGVKDDLLVHRLDISSQVAVDAFVPSQRTRLNKGVVDAYHWLVDGKGRLRAALAEREDQTVLLHGSGESFVEVLQLQSSGGFEPFALSTDGNLMYGRSDKGRTQRDLVVFDPAQQRVTETLFSKSGTDVASAILDDRHVPIGVTYYEDGRLISEYFDEHDAQLASVLRNTFPDRTVHVADRSRDGSHLIVWVEGAAQPPLLYYLDVTQRRASLLDQDRPWLDGEEFVASTLVELETTDGLRIEAFLTLPPAAGKRPLVVLPHGGPIGIADRRFFDPRVQFLASLGYAVLQVNYRGSGGYGKAFREAGYQAQGTRIEDDIDAAIRHVLARYPLDAERMCVVGASYGGYSALVSAMRWPDRFRCVVSISGVSDDILFFTASDSGRQAEVRELLVKIIGDPHTQLEEMMATSPLYNYDSIKVPVMLVHGEEDLRVDYEHTRRMVRMLNLAGRPPVLLRFPGEGHGLRNIYNIQAAWSGIAGFLQKHMAPETIH